MIKVTGTTEQDYLVILQCFPIHGKHRLVHRVLSNLVHLDEVEDFDSLDEAKAKLEMIQSTYPCLVTGSMPSERRKRSKKRRKARL